MPRLTDQQLAERETGLGATDVAAIAGVNPWRTPFEVYLEKIGELDPDARVDDAARGRMERGHRLEDVALEWDRDVTGEPFRRVRGTRRHPRLPFMFCHPDALRPPFSKTRRLIEVKTAGRAWKEVPAHVEVQCLAQMACTGATAVDVVLLTFDGPPLRFVVHRNELLVAALEELSTAFWDRVTRRDPPPVDGSAGARTWLDKTPWRDVPEAAADPEQTRILAEMVDVRAELKRLAARDDELVNMLAFTMGDTPRLRASGVASVIWTAPGERRKTEWQTVAETLRGDLEEDAWTALITEHTSVRPFGRSFRVTDERG